jgi:periplasmic divalent cation tolerance protein
MLFVQAIEIVTTLKDREMAHALGRAAVESGLAACAQLGGPITSCYEWKGSLEQEHEWILTLKTLPSLRPRLSDFLAGNHPYELPEILCREVLVSDAYFRWMEEGTGKLRIKPSGA